MERNKFTKETAGLPHKRGGSMGLTDKQMAWSNLNLLEFITGKSRQAVMTDLSRNGLRASSYEDVVDYIVKIHLVRDQ